MAVTVKRMMRIRTVRTSDISAAAFAVSASSTPVITVLRGSFPIKYHCIFARRNTQNLGPDPPREPRVLSMALIGQLILMESMRRVSGVLSRIPVLSSVAGVVLFTRRAFCILKDTGTNVRNEAHGRMESSLMLDAPCGCLIDLQKA